LKSFVITLPDQHSMLAANKCIASANIHIDIFEATTPKTLHNLPSKWTYPVDKNQERWESGMYLSAYQTRVLDKRIACFMSHYRLWKKCSDLNETIMVLEHDAVFVRKFDYTEIENKFTGDILGLNDPTKATRKYKVFDSKIQSQYSNQTVVVDVPWIDEQTVPQGLAGNSAYIIKPSGANKLIALVKQHGMWPNDAIMCKQLMPGSLQCVYPYYTKVQGIRSTTTK
jgi:GR25 family glycosyltransferase involved in LPS biosynthesis